MKGVEREVEGLSSKQSRVDSKQVHRVHKYLMTQTSLGDLCLRFTFSIQPSLREPSISPLPCSRHPSRKSDGTSRPWTLFSSFTFNPTVSRRLFQNRYGHPAGSRFWRVFSSGGTECGRNQEPFLMTSPTPKSYLWRLGVPHRRPLPINSYEFCQRETPGNHWRYHIWSYTKLLVPVFKFLDTFKSKFLGEENESFQKVRNSQIRNVQKFSFIGTLIFLDFRINDLLNRLPSIFEWFSFLYPGF